MRLGFRRRRPGVGESSAEATNVSTGCQPIDLLVATFPRGKVAQIMVGPDRRSFDDRPSADSAAKPAPSSEEQLRAVRQFVARVGGIENAREALALLALMKRAA